MSSRHYGPEMAPGFITDTSLEFVAHRLIFLGYDVASVPGARLEELFEAGRREGRTVLTLSTRHPRRFADVAAIVVPRGDPAGAVRAITSAHRPSGAAFSRCASCNQALQSRHPIEARGEVPARVLRSATVLRFCPVCGKWYWEGSHVARLREWLERALGRDLSAAGPGPEPAPGPDATTPDS
ncbi:MAG: Mut7-C RNAse domain-containing protein [Candidatus Eiseniibacteriota bacterium]